MICSACQHSNTSVLETRKEAAGVTRRRSCDKCGHRFVTRENEDDLAPRFTVGVDNRRRVKISWPGGEVWTQSLSGDLLLVLGAAWPYLMTLDDMRIKLYGKQKRSNETVKTTIFRLNQAIRPAGWGVAVIAKVGHGLVRLPK